MVEGGTERRLAAIVAIDVAGYSRLMGADEDGTLATLKAHREATTPIGERHGGRMVGTAGDGVLWEFPSINEAVAAAIEVQALVAERNADIPDDKQMLYRIGVNLGDVMIDGDDIYGDGINVAARIEALADPGGICLSRAARDQVRDRMDIAFDDMGEVEVKNITRPVRVFRVLLDGAAARATVRQFTHWQKFAAATVVILAIIGGGAGWWWWQSNQSVHATSPNTRNGDTSLEPSIAVLPFKTIGDTTQYGFISDGLAYDISGMLSRIPKLKVVARNSTGRLRGKQKNRQALALELGVSFLVDGSVQVVGNKLRVHAELVTAADNRSIWSGGFDGDLKTGDLFAFQDEITRTVVNTIADGYGIIARFQRSQLKNRSEVSLTGYECVLLAYYYFEVISPDRHLKARNCLEQAVKKEPNYADAWGWLAMIYANEIALGFNVRANSLERALQAAEKAIAIDSNNQTAWEGLAAAHYFRKEKTKFLAAARKAVSINPDNASTLGNLGFYMGNWGMYDEAIPWVEKAIELSPYPPFFFYQPLFQRALLRGEWQEALNFANHYRTLNPKLFWSHVQMAVVFGHMGKLTDARASLQHALELKPDIVETLRPFMNHWNDTEEYIRLIEDGLAKAKPKNPP